eukprot:COSAG01_NODE_1660_length_9588_cov_458.469175_9_plen_99_part_00
MSRRSRSAIRARAKNETDELSFGLGSACLRGVCSDHEAPEAETACCMPAAARQDVPRVLARGVRAWLDAAPGSASSIISLAEEDGGGAAAVVSFLAAV